MRYVATRETVEMFTPNRIESATDKQGELIDKLYISAKDILKKKECFSISSLKINGDDLISLGMKEGKEIGDTLNFLLDAVIDKKCINERQSLLNFYLKK